MAALLWLGISLAAHAQTTVEYIHTDALGTPIAVTDANKVVIETTEYEPYGAQVAGPVKDGPGFTGHVQDAATGLTYMQQRYYDPQVGAFLSVDPVSMYTTGDSRQFNAYAYAFNNPYRFNDPDGRQSSIVRELGRIIPIVTSAKNEQEQGIVDPGPSGTDSDGNGRPDNARPARPTSRDSVRRGRDGQPITSTSSAPPPEGGDGNDDDDPSLTHNPKHHQNSQSPEPKNVRELYRQSILDRNGVRWARDENGTIHRFSRPSNGETHWNGSTGGDKPIQMRNIPNEVLKQLK
ncbi:RHS repeat-associated core domain-containing protein [Pseudoxanthomonas sp. LARHCG66]